MPKKSQNSKNKPKSPILVKIIAVVLILFALQILILVFVSLYLHFFQGNPIPPNVNWAGNLIYLFAVSLASILVAIGLFFRKQLARYLAIIALFLISILNLRAEIINTDSPAIQILIIYSILLLAAFYLLFSKKVKRAFG
jgi:hypothetical protein